MDGAILTEDEVVEAVCALLVARGYEILSRANVRQHGYDIVAHGPRGQVIIEAKGGGSSKVGTKRYGLGFSTGQIFHHVAGAMAKAMRVASAGEAHAAIALPDSPAHRREVALIQQAIAQLKIGVFWVRPTDKAVEIDCPWLS